MSDQRHDELTARIEELERQVARLSKALTLMGIAAEMLSDRPTPGTSAEAPTDPQLIALRPA